VPDQNRLLLTAQRVKMSITRMRGEGPDLMGLEELCRDTIRGSDSVVEIGCYMGESSKIIGRHAGRLYCIDPWKDGLIETGSVTNLQFHYQEMSKVEILFDAAVANMQSVIKIRGASNDLADVFGDRSLDLVYIDSLHTYEVVRNDIMRWWPKVKQGGFIGGHNHSSRWPGVVRAVAEAFGKPDKLYRDTSWIVNKGADRILTL